MPINIVIRQANEQPIVKQTAKEFMFGYETVSSVIFLSFLLAFL